MLAWLLLPTAIRLSSEFGDADPDIDEHIAACLWIEVRTFRWRTSSRVAANIAWRVRNQVLMELGDRGRLADRGKRTLAHTLVDETLVRRARGAGRSVSAHEDELLEVLDWAVEQALISEADTGLLVDVVAAAARSASGPPAGGWLLGDQASELVAAEAGRERAHGSAPRQAKHRRAGRSGSGPAAEPEFSDSSDCVTRRVRIGPSFRLSGARRFHDR